ncbi:MAG TPA: hypothetical protein ENH26_03025 [Candidatus Wolfebacteria bacterium]|nr:hypothetical protein [Candidatus Wolfebacteria bacterium]
MLFRISKFLLYLVPFSVVIVYSGTLFPFIVGKYIFFRVVVELALIFFLLGWAKAQTNRDLTRTNTESQHKSVFSLCKSALVVAMAVFVLIFLLAGFFGYNPSASFWSNFERGEGSFQMLHFFVFFILLILLFKDKESWRKLFIVSIIVASLVILYGVAASLKYVDAEMIGNEFTGQGGFFYQTFNKFIGQNFSASSFRFAGSLGNPAYLGTYLIFIIFYALYLITELKRKKVFRYILIGLTAVFIIFLFLSGTRGAFLGLGAAVLAGLFYLFSILPSGWLRKTILSFLIVLIISSSLGFIFRQSIPILNNRIFNISFLSETFQTRLLLWHQSVKAFNERPILGWGPENFQVSFEKNYNPYFRVWFDRAHNIFFDYLVFAGILGLLSFMAIFVVYYRQFFKTRTYADETRTNTERSQYESVLSPYESALLFSLPIAYLVQGLVLFDVLPIYINLFLFLAFAVYKFQAPSTKLQINSND